MEFFTHLGFSEEPQYDNCVSVGDLIVMLLANTELRQAAMHEVADPKQGFEVLISIEAASTDDVDDLVKKVEQAGGAPRFHFFQRLVWNYV